MFDHVLVDEYQDTNALQADILEGLRPADGDTPRNVTVVGDDAQSIYGFRAATVHNILGFPERFPGTTVVTLERNYRSSAADPRHVERGDRAVAAAPREGAMDRPDRRCAARAAGLPGRDGTGRPRLPRDRRGP